ncbi:MAG TPA: efflux RND transporter periplasmic adaptor subunit [Syntrophorhabdaceae bacterium]|jgi:RND family efflux transporter MFP subunit
MKRYLFLFSLSIALAASFFMGFWWNHYETEGRAASDGGKLSLHADPGSSAFTGSVTADDERVKGSSLGRETPPRDGAVNISVEKQQLMGVKLAVARKTAGSDTLRVLGRVAPDETRIYRINAATDGWVRKVLPVTTGSIVRRDQLLATFYAPEFFSAMKAYLYGIRSLERFQKNNEGKEQTDTTDANIENYRNALRNLGMTEHQLDEIMRTRQGSGNVEIRAPQSGFVLLRNISEGERFQRGTELYRIADLSHVWVLADIFENESRYFTPGLQARVVHPGLNKSFRARVSHVLPQFDSGSRTLKVRLETDNPGFLLRQDMFVDVELPVTLPPATTVPADAVLDSGLKKTVFVAKGEGTFEPRKVETGWRMGGMVEIIKGLVPGERIVVSGNFLLDSESRMKSPAAAAKGE